MLYRFRGPNPTPYHQQLNLMRTPALNLQTSTTTFPYPPPLQTKLLIIFIALTFESYGGAGGDPRRQHCGVRTKFWTRYLLKRHAIHPRPGPNHPPTAKSSPSFSQYLRVQAPTFNPRDNDVEWISKFSINVKWIANFPINVKWIANLSIKLRWNVLLTFQ